MSAIWTLVLFVVGVDDSYDWNVQCRSERNGYFIVDALDIMNI